MTAPSPGAPVSFLVDFDGTIAVTDVADTILRRHAVDESWREKDRLYEAGRLGSRELMSWDLTRLPDDRALLEATVAAQPHDATFAAFVASVRRWGAELEVVSDGFGFYVRPILARMGLADLPVATSVTRFETGAGHPLIGYPFGHPECFVCGTCKRERVRAHHRLGRLVVFVGDGRSDRYGAAHAEVIFAKHRLAELCEAEGWPYHPWEAFSDVERWADGSFRSGFLPRDPDGLAAARERLVALRWPGESVAVHPEERHFVCGPEAWGPGRTDPPAG